MFARTERLLLRPSWPEDAGAIYSAINDEEIIRNLARAPWPYTLNDARSYTALEHDRLYPGFLLFKRTSAAPILIGSCGLGNRDDEADLGYWIARPFWGQGYASEAARAVVGIAKAIGHQRLSCGHFVDNPASGRVMLKLGFRPYGKIEQRYSKGRGESAACVTMALSLDDDGDDGGDADGDTDVMFMHNKTQPMAA